MIDLAAPHLLAAALALSSAAVDTRAEAQALTCLALNVYHEARSESATGQAAVAHVTLNRVRSRAFPADICGVVTQQAKGQCQFSWVCDGNPVAPRNAAAYDKALRVATRAMTGAAPDPTGGATHFISAKIDTPKWARRLTETTAIEGHRFFR